MVQTQKKQQEEKQEQEQKKQEQKKQEQQERKQQEGVQQKGVQQEQQEQQEQEEQQSHPMGNLKRPAPPLSGDTPADPPKQPQRQKGPPATQPIHHTPQAAQENLQQLEEGCPPAALTPHMVVPPGRAGAGAGVGASNIRPPLMPVAAAQVPVQSALPMQMQAQTPVSTQMPISGQGQQVHRPLPGAAAAGGEPLSKMVGSSVST